MAPAPIPAVNIVINMAQAIGCLLPLGFINYPTKRVVCPVCPRAIPANFRRLIAIAHRVDSMLLDFVEWLVATEEKPTAVAT